MDYETCVSYKETPCIIDEAITNLTKRVNENEDAIGGFESTCK